MMTNGLYIKTLNRLNTVPVESLFGWRRLNRVHLKSLCIFGQNIIPHNWMESKNGFLGLITWAGWPACSSLTAQWVVPLLQSKSSKNILRLPQASQSSLLGWLVSQKRVNPAKQAALFHVIAATEWTLGWLVVCACVLTASYQTKLHFGFSQVGSEPETSHKWVNPSHVITITGKPELNYIWAASGSTCPCYSPP